MIEKLAVLAIDKADGSLSLESGEKGEIYQKTRQMIRDLNAKPGHGVVRLRAFYQGGLLKGYKFKAEMIAAASAPDESESDPDAKEIRAKLKALGVSVPPRISLEKLLDLAIANGVEV